MGRIRSLKPQFFMSETVGAVSFGARLLFAGLWTLADREGRLVWKVKEVRAQIFPHDEGLQLAPLVEELVREDHVRFYQDAERIYLWIPRFTEHQRPHPKEPPSVLPAWPDGHDRGWMPWKKTAAREIPGSIPPAPVGREGKGMDLGKGTDPDPVVPVPNPVPPTAYLWSEVQRWLQTDYGMSAATIATWFAVCDVHRQTPTLLELSTGQQIVGKQLKEHYAKAIDAALAKLAPGVRWSVMVRPLATRSA